MRKAAERIGMVAARIKRCEFGACVVPQVSLLFLESTPDFFDMVAKLFLKGRVVCLRCECVCPGICIRIRACSFIAETPVHDDLLHGGVEKTLRLSAFANGFQCSFTPPIPRTILNESAAFLEELKLQGKRP